jgi:hypothetical protein
VEWVKDTAQPRVFGNPISYLLLETKATVYVAEELNRIGFTGKDDGELRQENGYE